MQNNDVKVRFGSVVRAYRSQLGISQEELAGRAGLHRTYISDVERGARNVSLESIEKLSNALGVALAALFHPGEIEPGPARRARSHPWANILLVEDNADDVTLTLGQLKNAHLCNHVHVAKDGQEALDFLFGTGIHAAEGAEPPDLVLLDLGLPKVGGLEVLRRLKEHPATRTIPVIVLTASEYDKDVSASKRLGAEAYLVKPVDVRNFTQAAVQLRLPWALLRPSAMYC